MFLVVWMLLFYLFESAADVDIKKLIVFLIFSIDLLAASHIFVNWHVETKGPSRPDKQRRRSKTSNSITIIRAGCRLISIHNSFMQSNHWYRFKVFVYLLLGGPPRVGPVFLTPPAPSFGGAFDFPGRGNLHPNFRSSFEMICGLGTA